MNLDKTTAFPPIILNPFQSCAGVYVYVDLGGINDSCLSLVDKFCIY